MVRVWLALFIRCACGKAGSRGLFLQATIDTSMMHMETENTNQTAN